METCRVQQEKREPDRQKTAGRKPETRPEALVFGKRCERKQSYHRRRDQEKPPTEMICMSNRWVPPGPPRADQKKADKEKAHREYKS